MSVIIFSMAENKENINPIQRRDEEKESELEKLFNEQEEMRLEIKKLNESLLLYEKKWSKIVKNVIRENAELKSENEKLKKMMNVFKASKTVSTVDTHF